MTAPPIDYPRKENPVMQRKEDAVTQRKEDTMTQAQPDQSFPEGEYELRAWQGEWCIIQIEASRLAVDRGDLVSVGDPGNEELYWVWELLPLLPQFPREERPIAVVLYHQPPVV